MIYVNCPYCGESLSHRDSSAGRLMPCKVCGENYRVPVLSAIPSPKSNTPSGCTSIVLIVIGLIFLSCCGGGFSQIANKEDQKTSEPLYQVKNTGYRPPETYKWSVVTQETKPVPTIRETKPQPTVPEEPKKTETKPEPKTTKPTPKPEKIKDPNEDIAASKMRVARLLVADRSFDSAIGRLREIIRLYPETETAKEAQKELEKIEK